MAAVNSYSITSSRNVSIQVQPFRYKSQSGHSPPGSKCLTGTQAQLSIKLSIQCSKCHTRTQVQLSTSYICISIPNDVGTILPCYINTGFQFAINATQRHKSSNKLYISIPNDVGTILPYYINTGYQDYSLADQIQDYWVAAL